MDQQMNEETSRRGFLGVAAATVASVTLLDVMTGAAPATAVTAGPARPGSPTAPGQTVAILGAGPAGLAAALSFVEAGYRVTVLEATGRVGGRTLTARQGDEVTEVWGDGSVRTQTCRFDSGLYLNLGAGRIPYHHQRVIDLCRKLAVPLEPYIHTTTANLFQSDKGWRGTTRPNRRIANDTRGYVAQLLTEALRKGTLEDGLTPDQRDQFVSLLARFGKLDTDSSLYVGSTRSGLGKPISVQQAEEPIDPLRLEDLLASEYWRHGFFQDSDWHWHTTSFQPVGGMDSIWRRVAAALPAGTVSYDSPVSGIRLDDDGVAVTWSTGGGAPTTARFDYCLSNIPVSVLREQVELTGNFSADFEHAVRRTPFAPACKVGWQANRRFWESDKYQIYGGISRIDHEISQVWYPSNDYFSAKGTMTGAYNSYADAATMGDRPHEERLRVARAGAVRLHDEMAADAVVPDQLGMSIAWHKVRYQRGAWADWDPSKPELKPLYETLIYPQGQDNFFVIGDQVSVLPGWQEGALMSAEWAFGWIHDARRAATARVLVRRLPDARELTTGEH